MNNEKINNRHHNLLKNKTVDMMAVKVSIANVIYVESMNIAVAEHNITPREARNSEFRRSAK